MHAAPNRYRRQPGRQQARVVVLLPRSEAQAIDAWAIPAGHPSRSAAIRLLLKKGLESIANSPAGLAG